MRAIVVTGSCLYAGVFAYCLATSPELRSTMLALGAQLCQRTAGQFGAWGIELEKSFYESLEV